MPSRQVSVSTTLAMSRFLRPQVRMMGGLGAGCFGVVLALGMMFGIAFVADAAMSRALLSMQQAQSSKTGSTASRSSY